MEFMVNYPELGRVDSLDIYADEYLDGNLSSCHNKYYSNSQKQKNILLRHDYGVFFLHSKFKLFVQKWIMQYLLFSNSNW